MVSDDVIGKLREAVAKLKTWPETARIVEQRDAVLARFQPVLSPNHVHAITAEEFCSFLAFENNCHWTGLQRWGSRLCDDVNRLRKALAMLLDESHPVADRLNKLSEMRFGMNKAIATPILLIAQPDRYGVWNKVSEGAMTNLAIWPQFGRGESFGGKYVKINEKLRDLRDELRTDFWTLDAVWWYLEREDSGEWAADAAATESGPTSVENDQRFRLERYLHEFLRDNWNQTELGREWALHSEPGDEEAGYEYPTAIGRIDILARHRKEPHWLVVELKRDQTSDQTLGQLLRYKGWVEQHLAKDGDQVHGLIICRQADNALRYALSTVQNVSLRLYDVQFHLKTPEPTWREKG